MGNFPWQNPYIRLMAYIFCKSRWLIYSENLDTLVWQGLMSIFDLHQLHSSFIRTSKMDPRLAVLKIVIIFRLCSELALFSQF